MVNDKHFAASWLWWWYYMAIFGDWAKLLYLRIQWWTSRIDFICCCCCCWYCRVDICIWSTCSFGRPHLRLPNPLSLPPKLQQTGSWLRPLPARKIPFCWSVVKISQFPHLALFLSLKTKAIWNCMYDQIVSVTKFFFSLRKEPNLKVKLKFEKFYLRYKI